MFTCTYGAASCCLCVCQQLFSLSPHTVQAQLQLGELTEGVLVVLHLLLNAWGETLQNHCSLHVVVQTLQAFSYQNHPLIQLQERQADIG